MLVILEQYDNIEREIYTALQQRHRNVSKVIERLKEIYPNVHENFWKELYDIVSQKEISLSQYRSGLRDILRLDRTDLVEDFANELRKITENAQDVPKWYVDMVDAIRRNYTKIYSLGANGEVDNNVIERQVQSQFVYLSAFGVALGIAIQRGEISKRLLHRAELYGLRGVALYEMGKMHGANGDDLVYWRLGLAEHCPDCIDRANASPFLRRNLPSYPADGATICKTNCKCRLEVVSGEKL